MSMVVFGRQVVLPAVVTGAAFGVACYVVMLAMPSGGWVEFFKRVAVATAAYGLIGLLTLVSGDERRQMVGLLLRPLRRQRAEV